MRAYSCPNGNRYVDRLSSTGRRATTDRRRMVKRRLDGRCSVPSLFHVRFDRTTTDVPRRVAEIVNYWAAIITVTRSNQIRVHGRTTVSNGQFETRANNSGRFTGRVSFVVTLENVPGRPCRIIGRPFRRRGGAVVRIVAEKTEQLGVHVSSGGFVRVYDKKKKTSPTRDRFTGVTYRVAKHSGKSTGNSTDEHRPWPLWDRTSGKIVRD